MIIRKPVAQVVRDLWGNHSAKVLILDIETAPNKAFIWRMWKENIGIGQLVSEWYMLSFCAKWLGQDKAVYMSQKHIKDIEDDSKQLAALWDLLDKADIVVAHNGRKFDVKKVNARFFAHGMKPPSPYKVVDTLDIAKGNFSFTSNKLEYLTTRFNKEYTKLKHGKYPGFELWEQVMLGNADAWEEMREYNTYDVYALEELYINMRPWDTHHPNVNVYVTDEQQRCTVCGSVHLKPRGYYHTNTGKYHRLRCESCGKWNRTRYTINTTGKRKALLT